ncbi:MAG: DNA polymerase III subunit beta [Dehalococcoidia bacterium]|nr:DNA polymerase III subunit beta [Dehalococcoidia bacterium]MDW8119469.1 DNA polymerase III subunit beta [Chloroflexota bacterium]
MKVSCLQENLDKALRVVARAVPSRPSEDVLLNILVQTDEGRLRLTATNLELAITVWVGAKVDAEGGIAVPAQRLRDFVAQLPPERVDLSRVQHPLGLQVSCAWLKAVVRGVEASAYPPLPVVKEATTARISHKALGKAISQVAFAAATDESRPILTGIRLELEGDRFTMAAADGFRLAVHTGRLLQPVEKPVGLVVPAKAFKEVASLLDDSDEPVTLDIAKDGAGILFRLKGVEIYSQLLQGTYPNFRQLIPQASQTRVVLDCRRFLQTVKAGSAFARMGSQIVRLMVEPGPPGKVTITTGAEEEGSATGELEASVEGEGARIAFNSRYLQDVLTAIDGEQVRIGINTPSSPGVFRPVGADDYVHVVMPMFVQWP